jgi:ATP-dependent helicase HrpA
VCYRLYSAEDYAAMPEYSTPEILRQNLDALVLQMMALGLPDPLKFPFIQPPDQSRLKGAVVSLKNHASENINK